MESPEQQKNESEEIEKRAQFILERLGFTWQELKGKVVLDIGAGSAMFAQAARVRGVDIISFDLHPYINEAVKNAERLGINPALEETTDILDTLIDVADMTGGPKPVPYVRGTANQLPFADASFDYVVTHAGPPITWTETMEDASKVLKEMERVLRPGGILRISPANTSVLEKDFPELQRNIKNESGIATYYQYQK